ncbi:MAG: hypothetical protein QM811_18840 [Pirellulales bacterium]
MSLSYRELKRRYDADGARKTVTHLSEALTAGHLTPRDFSLRDLAEALIPDGGAWVRGLDPREHGATALLEAGTGVDASAFLNVTGQLISHEILRAYRHESFVFSKLVRTIPTRLDGERIPGVEGLADSAREIGPGMPYPNAGFGEDYVDTPPTKKHGLIVPVTREAIFFDRTHLVLSRAAEVGELLGVNKEKRIADVVLGIVNPYKRLGASSNTYLDAGAWINAIAENPLEDWTNVDVVEQMFADMLDPSTGEPIVQRATTVLVMPARRHAAHRVFNASTIDYTNGDATTTAANPLGNYRVLESRLAYRRLLAAGVSAGDAQDYWYVGEFDRAFAYMENWPVTVTQSGPQSEADFNQDLVVRFKASERGAPAVLNPRYVVQSKNT